MLSTTEIRIATIEQALTALWAYTVHGTQVTRIHAGNRLATEMGFLPDEPDDHRSTLIWCTQFGPLGAPGIIRTHGNTIDQCLDRAERQLSELQQAVEAEAKRKRPRRARTRKPTRLGRSIVPAV